MSEALPKQAEQPHFNPLTQKELSQKELSQKEIEHLDLLSFVKILWRKSAWILLLMVLASAMTCSDTPVTERKLTTLVDKGFKFSKSNWR